MKVNGRNLTSIWRDGQTVWIIDQTKLPGDLCIEKLESLKSVANAIKSMQVRGAPLIGVSAAYGMALGVQENPSDKGVKKTLELLISTRPTAVNLKHALNRIFTKIENLPPHKRAKATWLEADQMASEDIAQNRAIGENGFKLIQKIAQEKGRVNILTHCNAGWLATVDYGTALSPIFLGFDHGLDIHVWVDETRPRNQGHLTAWELGQHGVDHTLIVDNAGGHLMQIGEVDLVIVGADRVSASGDVCNKIGTYLKALSARDNDIPFYAAVPIPTIDWDVVDAKEQIPIEERSREEILASVGANSIRGSKVANPGFDITPAKLLTGLITDHGIFHPKMIGALKETRTKGTM